MTGTPQFKIIGQVTLTTPFLGVVCQA